MQVKTNVKAGQLNIAVNVAVTQTTTSSQPSTSFQGAQVANPIQVILARE
jgi:hypothetical protein